MSVAGIVNGVYIVSGMIAGHGTEEQKKRYLPKIAAGEHRCCFMMTEPEAGSDVRAIRTTARRDGDELVINGQKMWVTNGMRASLMAVLVKTDPSADPPQAGMTALILEKEPGAGRRGGITIPEAGLPKLGYKGVESTEMIFDDHRVAGVGDPRRARRRGPGLLPDDERHRDRPHQRRRARTRRRPARATSSPIRYAQERDTFGKPIAQHQLIQAKLADMATGIEAAKHLIAAAARKKDAGGRADVEAGMAKLFATEVAQRCVEESMRIHGGYGYSKEFEIERLYRDSPLLLIGEGTNEIQRLIIARGLLRRHSHLAELQHGVWPATCGPDPRVAGLAPTVARAATLAACPASAFSPPATKDCRPRSGPLREMPREARIRAERVSRLPVAAVALAAWLPTSTPSWSRPIPAFG